MWTVFALAEAPGEFPGPIKQRTTVQASSIEEAAVRGLSVFNGRGLLNIEIIGAYRGRVAP
jgi:hypothetical protein